LAYVPLSGRSRSVESIDDEYSLQYPGKVPWLHRINDAEMQGENIDTEEEIQWGIMMSGQRGRVLAETHDVDRRWRNEPFVGSRSQGLAFFSASIDVMSLCKNASR